MNEWLRLEKVDHNAPGKVTAEKDAEARAVGELSLRAYSNP
jgi:hypothetical protein